MSGYDDWIGQNIPDEIMQQAAAWLALLDSDKATRRDRENFAVWLASDPLHQGAFEELSEVWAKLHMLSDVPAMTRHPDVIPFPLLPAAPARVPDQAPVVSRNEWSTLAAVLIVVVGVLSHLVFGTPSDRHATDVGEIQRVTLADGSMVEMNALSLIEVKIDDSRREIRMPSGEAVFHVEKDARPFIVYTELARVSAVGTRFFVRADSARVEVAVIDGLVSVSPTASQTALTEYESDLLVRFSDEIALLGAGQRLELSRELQSYVTAPAGAIENELSWRNGEIVFSDTPLLAALVEMRRHNKTRIIVGDPVLNSLRISGRFPVNDMDAFLQALATDYGILADTSAASYITLRAN